MPVNYFRRLRELRDLTHLGFGRDKAPEQPQPAGPNEPQRAPGEIPTVCPSTALRAAPPGERAGTRPIVTLPILPSFLPVQPTRFARLIKFDKILSGVRLSKGALADRVL